MENNHSEVQKNKLTIDKVPVQNKKLTEAEPTEKVIKLMAFLLY